MEMLSTSNIWYTGASRMREGTSLRGVPELFLGRAERFTNKPELGQAILQFINKYTSPLFLKNKSDTDI